MYCTCCWVSRHDESVTIVETVEGETISCRRLDTAVQLGILQVESLLDRRQMNPAVLEVQVLLFIAIAEYDLACRNE